MTQSAPKRYAHALIRHFIIFALFMPTFYSKYGHEYYQDVFFANIIALLFTINILHKWTLDFKRNTMCVIGLAIMLLLYNGACFYNYHLFNDGLFWKSYQFNVSIAFVFFLILLIVKEHHNIISDKVIKLVIRTIIINNLIGFYFRAQGYCKIHMMNLTHQKIPVNPANEYFSWLYFDASEYALILLLSMALFAVYKDLFRNIWTYCLSQGTLLIGLYLTKSTTFLLAAGILLGGQVVHLLINKLQLKEKYVLYSFPVALALGAGVFYFLFTHVESFRIKFHIWKGSLEMILGAPLGFRTTFGPHKFEVANVVLPLNQAHNVFLNHMLRYSLPVGIIFTFMFVLIILFSMLRNPNYLSLGIWVALLLPLNMDYSLQTLNLPFALFMIYCIFFRKDVRNNELTDETSQYDLETIQ